MGRYLLGVDVGTTSLKVAVIDQDAKLLGISSKAYRLITPRQDYVQIDAESMWDAFVECIRLLHEGKGIDKGNGYKEKCCTIRSFIQTAEAKRKQNSF